MFDDLSGELGVKSLVEVTVYENSILANLPSAELSLLLPHLTYSETSSGHNVYKAGVVIQTLFFPERGFISMCVADTETDDTIEVGVVGPEGVLGSGALLLGRARVSYRYTATVPGAMHGLPTAALLPIRSDLPVFRRLLMEHSALRWAEMVRLGVCNAFHTTQQRTARWLLSANDRVRGGPIHVTQDLLAGLLGISRSSLTIALTQLGSQGAIRARRGQLLVCDHAALQAKSCGCYKTMKRIAAQAGDVLQHRPALDPEVE